MMESVLVRLGIVLVATVVLLIVIARSMKRAWDATDEDDQ